MSYDAWKIELIGGRHDGSTVTQLLKYSPLGHRINVPRPTKCIASRATPDADHVVFDQYVVTEFTEEFDCVTGELTRRAWANLQEVP